MAGIFKAYDIRGAYPETIDESITHKVGRAFVTFLNCKQVVVGHDARISSPSLYDAFIQGCLDQGADVIAVGFVSTPELEVYCAMNKMPPSAMITASHNPKQDNGIKLNRDHAIFINYERGLDKIEKLVHENKFVDAVRKGTVEKRDIQEDYVKQICSLIKSDISGMKLVVDASNGCGGHTIREICSRLNIVLEEINFEPDGNFPNHEPNPLIPDTHSTVKKKVKELKADMGAVFDGDADRVVFIDDKGEYVYSAQQLALLCMAYLPESKNEKVAHDLITSRIVEQKIRELGGTPIRTRVGYAYIYHTLKENNCIIGGETSGKFFFRELDFAANVDLVILRILEYLKKIGRKLSDIHSELDIYANSGELNYRVKDADVALQDIEKHFKNDSINKMDGISITRPDSWFVVRKSNTEPILRVRIEGKDKVSVDGLKEEIEKVISTNR
ncbi:phosphomannomutase/phosphoglucomutase [Candidatus Woesearchaeota archaeon]|nr:phosphomannomutase/phosphoglucomutase [Candidatus Woesearchaeota archaeon]